MPNEWLFKTAFSPTLVRLVVLLCSFTSIACFQVVCYCSAKFVLLICCESFLKHMVLILLRFHTEMENIIFKCLLKVF